MNYRLQIQESLNEHDENYVLKTNSELIEMIMVFGCGETEFHTADIERLIKENNLEIDIKKLKKEKRMNNVPLGANKDPRAPWNAPLDVKHKRFVSVTISYYDEVELPPDAEEEQINEAFHKKVEDAEFPKEFDIDEVVVIDD